MSLAGGPEAIYARSFLHFFPNSQQVDQNARGLHGITNRLSVWTGHNVIYITL
jgi:hypothetical protein